MSATSQSALKNRHHNHEHNSSRQTALVPRRGAVEVYEYSRQQDRASGMSPALLNLIAYATTAIVTRSKHDRGSERHKGVVLIVSLQSGLTHSLQPYLDAAGGDARRIYAYACRYCEGNRELVMRLPDHAARLRNAILACAADLVVIDRLTEFLNDNSGRSVSQKLHDALLMLERIAVDTDAAIVVGIVRAEATIHELSIDKAKLTSADAVYHEALSQPVRFPTAKRQSAGKTPSRQTIAPHTARSNARQNVLNAIEFLRRVLSHGPCAGKDLEQLAALRGLKPRTLRTAREKLGLLVWKSQSADGPWVWELPYVNGTDTRH